VTDLDNTDRCEPAASCEGCGASVDLAVQTATTPIGVICLTLCPPCTDAARLGMADGVHKALGHCAHLVITADQMEAAMNPTNHTVRHYGDD
jgi:hypothetical protein